METRFEQESENEALIYYKGPEIKSPVELIEHLQIDLDVWQICDEEIKTWPVHAKREIKDLVIDGGVSSGTIKTGGMIVKTLFGVRIRLARRNPNNIYPLVLPIISNDKFEFPNVKTKSSGITTAIIAGDAQIGFERDENDNLIPFHDERALDILVSAARDLQPDEIFLPGDWLDLSEWSTKFIRHPRFAYTTQMSFNECHRRLAQLRSVAPGARIVFFEGNHEKRLPDAIATYMPFAYGLKRADALPYQFPVMSVPYFLSLDNLGIEWAGNYPDSAVWLNDRIRIEHGNTTKLKAEDFILLRGHDHRIGLRARTRYTSKGSEVLAEFSFGCLSTPNAPGRSRREDWQLGFGVLEYEKQGDLFCGTPVFIENGRALFNGKIYEAS